MQINTALEKNNHGQAGLMRSVWYPNTTASQTRDSFIFNECIDRFNAKPEVLLPIIERDGGKETVQRMLTIKADSNERLKTIAFAISKSVAATYRAIIAYTVDSIRNNQEDNGDTVAEISETPGVSQLLIEKIALLEKQLEDCNQTMQEIKTLMED